MKNHINKILKKYSVFLEKRSAQKLVQIVLTIWVGLIFFLYCLNYGYVEIICLINWLFFLVIFILTIFYGRKTKIDRHLLQKIISIFPSSKRELHIKLKYLFIIFPALTILLANVFLLDEISSINGIQDLIFIEINIFQKVSSIFIFYTLLFLLAYAAGRKILTSLNFNFESKTELFIFSIGLGLIPIIFITFFLAIIGWLYRWPIYLLITLLLLLSFREFKKILKEFDRETIILSLKDYLGSIKCLILTALLILLSFSFVINFKPIPFTTDDLHTYFNVPNLYANYHRYKPLLHCDTSNMGQNTEMIYTAIISAFGQQYIIHFQFIFFVLCLVGFYCLLKKMFGEKHSLLAILFLYFVPWNPYYYSTTKVEFFLAFYLLLILFSFYLWHNKNFNNKFLYLIGILSGISLGIKYNAALLILPIYLLIFIVTVAKFKKDFFARLKPLVISSLLCISFFSPWAIKNWIYFDNPMYPFLNSKKIMQNYQNNQEIEESQKFIEGRSREINNLRHAGQNNKKTIKNFLLTTWDQSIGKNINNGLWINFGFIPLVTLPFFLFFIKDKKIVYAFFIIITYFFLWYIIEGARSWYAFFGFMIIYAILPYILLKNKLLAFFYLLFATTITMISTYIFPANIKYLFGVIDTNTFISRVIPYYETAKFINSLDLSPKEKILFPEEFRTAFIERNDEITIVDPYLSKSTYALNKGEDCFYDFLKNNSVKYIVHSKIEQFYKTWPLRKYQSLDNYLSEYGGKTPSIYEDIEKLNSFLNNRTQILFSDGYYSLYKLY